LKAVYTELGRGHIIEGHWKDFPFPAGKLKEEFDQYADKDLAQLVYYLYRACYVLDSIISEPLSQELLHYYVYASLPCQSRVIDLYKGDDVQLSPAKGPTKWKYAREAITESRKYGPEPIMNLIITDMAYRNPKLAEQVERLCEAVVREAIETDEYFGRLVELTPDYWNERVYEPRIKKFKACLEKLFNKLGHIRRLLETELNGRELAEIEQETEAGKAPPGAKSKIQKWAELTIDFIDDKMLRFKTKNGRWSRFNYAELGFKDKKKGLPNKSWEIFLLFAEVHHDGYIDFNINQSAQRKQPYGGNQKRAAFMKCKDRICKTLKDYFGPQEVPIRYVKKEQRWQVKFTLSDGRQKTTG